MQFEHVNQYTFTDIEAVHEFGKRYYLTPDGKKYVSVTSLLGANPEKRKSLAQWRRNVGAAEADRITKEAAAQGTAMHSMCEQYLKNEDIEETENLHAPDLFDSIRPIIAKNIDRVHTLEAPLWSHQLRLAGRVDCVANWDGKPAIIDFKTSMKPKKKEWIHDYFKQATAYAVMFRERTGISVPRIAILIAVRDSKPQVFVERAIDWIDPLMDAIDSFYEAR